MKRLKRIISIALILVMFFSASQVLAANSNLVNLMSEPEFTAEFKEWLKLSPEEKETIGMPRSREYLRPTYVTRNPIKLAQNVGSVTLEKFNLKDYIPENLVIRNQMDTPTCWAFASIGMLESTLGFSNYNNGKELVVYDFSERHMQYGVTRVFANGEINKRGLNTNLDAGGNYQFSLPYLLSGFGPVKELDMPFENNCNIIELSKIQNKDTVAYIKDTFVFPTHDGENTTEIMQFMKEHIKKHGGIEAGINGASLFGDSYNLETGAMFVNDKTKFPYDHDILIVGWDDSYSKDNFNEEMRPKNDGAWIIKNSWGTQIEQTMEEMKQTIWEIITEANMTTEWKSAEEIPDSVAKDLFVELGFKIEGNKAILNVGKDGFMYLSYEDANVYDTLMGIENATDEMYDHIYLYDYLGAMGILKLATQKVIIANVFDKQSDKTEFLTEVALEVLETTTCKVYVNPNNDSKDKKDFVEVELKAGKTETIDAGYHTLEFLNPIELTGDKFVVAIEHTGTRVSGYNVSTERPIENSAWSVVELEEDKCFWTTPEYFPKNSWISFSELEEVSKGEISNSDTTIKAITVLEENKDTKILEKIEITTPPTKTEYVEGEDFDKKGMVVSAVYTNGTKEEITDYTIQNGNDLKLDQEAVIIEYQEKVVTQKITVKAKATTPDEEKPGDEDKPGDDEKPGETDKEDEKVKPEVSDFSKVEAKVNSVKAYYFTDKDKKEFITIDLDLEKITRKDKNDSYKYYYYLSSSPSTQNIKKWVEVKESQKSNTKLEFVINTKDISNYTEVSKAEKLYLYVKEVVTKGDLSEEVITKAILLETEGKVEIYKDNIKQTQNKPEDNKPEENKPQDNKPQDNKPKDDTTANQKLPAAGLKAGIVFVISIIAIFGIIKLVQYKKMDF